MLKNAVLFAVCIHINRNFVKIVDFFLWFLYPIAFSVGNIIVEEAKSSTK